MNLKVKRIILGIGFVYLFMFDVVMAATTGFHPGPSLLPEGRTYKGRVYSLTGPTNFAMGINCKVYFKNFGTIDNRLASWSNRNFIMALWEKDGIFSKDDRIKVYKGKFKGRKLERVDVLDYPIINGKVDDDDTAELYLAYYIGKNSEDRKGIYTGSFFDYNIIHE